MKYIVVDIESDGQIPHLFSMLSFGAVDLDNFNNTFYAKVKPISSLVDEGALAHSGFDSVTRLEGDDPSIAMTRFADWLTKTSNGDRLKFVSDNAGFDWQFINYYFHMYLGENPFGFSPFSITSFYAGLTKNTRTSFKHLRKTRHTHNALEDAMGNAEALNTLRTQMKNF